jgi:hypothetical protein
MLPQLDFNGLHQGVLVIVSGEQPRDPGDSDLLQDGRHVAELPFDRLLGPPHLRRELPVQVGLIDLVAGPLPIEHQEIIGDHDGDLLGRPVGALGSRRCGLGIH